MAGKSISANEQVSAGGPSPPADSQTLGGEILPAQGERAIIIGQTGSGKTTAARWMLERTPNSPTVIYDTKEEPKFERMKNVSVVYNQRQMFEAVDNPEFDFVVYRPEVEYLSDPKALDALLMSHYSNLRGVDCYIDELYQFHNHGVAGPGLVALYTRGRSRGITTIACTQRPAWVSRFALSEAQVFYVFHLNSKEDRKRVQDASGMPDYANPPKNWFRIYRPGEEHSRLMRPVPIETGEQLTYTDQVANLAQGEEGTQATDNIPHVWI